jgi:hypothetical protein
MLMQLPEKLVEYSDESLVSRASRYAAIYIRKASNQGRFSLPLEIRKESSYLQWLSLKD